MNKDPDKKSMLRKRRMSFTPDTFMNNIKTKQLPIIEEEEGTPEHKIAKKLVEKIIRICEIQVSNK